MSRENQLASGNGVIGKISSQEALDMEHHPVVFLDIDGVLVNETTMLTDYFATSDVSYDPDFVDTYDPDAVEALKDVVLKHSAVLVISSSRRLFGGWPDSRKKIEASLANAGWNNPPIIDQTPILNEPGRHISRGDEIDAWLRKNPTRHYVIIDDDPDILPSQLPFFVKCDSSTGFTQHKARLVDQVLMKGKRNNLASATLSTRY